jgi:hypothetical protein
MLVKLLRRVWAAVVGSRDLLCGVCGASHDRRLPACPECGCSVPLWWTIDKKGSVQGPFCADGRRP